MSNFLRVALVQHLHGLDPAVPIREAAAKGAKIVVFPEMYSNGYAAFESGNAAAEKQWRAEAVKPDGAFVGQFRAAAEENKLHVVTTFLEAGDPDPFNSALLIDRNGDTVLHHRKVHTCFFDVPQAACGRGENFLTVPIVTEMGQVTVGLMICMDREYAEAGRSISAAGAEIALVPNCCNLAVDRNEGDVRIAQARGRAFETVMGIAVANYPAPRCDGHSFAVDPRGRVIVMGDDRPAVILADFDVDQIRRAREEDWFRWRSEPALSRHEREF
jgi:predicted amidohydrolase